MERERGREEEQKKNEQIADNNFWHEARIHTVHTLIMTQMMMMMMTAVVDRNNNPTITNFCPKTSTISIKYTHKVKRSQNCKINLNVHFKELCNQSTALSLSRSPAVQMIDLWILIFKIRKKKKHEASSHHKWSKISA